MDKNYFSVFVIELSEGFYYIGLKIQKGNILYYTQWADESLLRAIQNTYYREKVALNGNIYKLDAEDIQRIGERFF